MPIAVATVRSGGIAYATDNNKHSSQFVNVHSRSSDRSRLEGEGGIAVEKELIKRQIAMMCNNTVRVICFTVLAVLFGKWWIVLLSALFITYEESKEKKKHEQSDINT